MCFWCHIFLCVLSAVPSLEAKETPERFRDHEYFLRKLFDKYGHDGKMTFEGFEHLLENLGLAHITIRDHDLSAHRPEGANVGFVNRHAHHVHVDGVGAAAVVDEHHDHHDHGHGGDSSDHTHASEGDHHARVQRDLSSQDHTEAVDSSNRTEAPSVPKVSATTRTAEVSFEKCLTATEILHTVDTSPEANVIDLKDFQQLCPALVYQLDEKHCSVPQLNRHIHHHSDGEEETTVDFKVWMYAFLGVLGISLTGLLSVAIVPLMQKVFYHTLIQFLVGLAVGSLTGDALLHLLPHAMSGHHHDHAEEGGDGENYHRKHSPRSNNSIQSNPTPKRLRRSSQDDQSKVVGEKLSHHKQGSYGFVDPSGMEALERLTAVPAEELELSPSGRGLRGDHGHS
ncbi:hypothetical protein MTO96_025695 [Rhipicephalus appendiculatus]